ncbi:MAG: acetyltransferase [Bacteroidetes bacterium]|nr:acetyltransferase [Bacteroidota bacterium]
MYIYGASGHGSVIFDILSKSNGEDINFIDDKLYGSSYCGINIISPLQIKMGSESSFIIAIGNNSIRKRIANSLEVNYLNAIHPNAIVSRNVNIGFGISVMAGCIINPNCTIGNHTILNTAASIDHDCIISDFVHISPNATLCGGVTVGSGSHVGAGVVVIPGIKIGENCVIGAGSVIIRDVPDKCTVVGNPGHILRKNIV